MGRTQDEKTCLLAIKEDLLQLIKCHAAIWDLTNADHCKRNVITNDWMNILQELESTYTKECLSSQGMNTVEKLKSVYQNMKRQYNDIKTK